jgi:hypothetical protein
MYTRSIPSLEIGLIHLLTQCVYFYFQTVVKVINEIFEVQSKAVDVSMTAEGWTRDNIVLAHVPRKCLSDMRYFIGPFPEKMPSGSQRFTTLLLDKSKRLRDYFSIGRRPAVVERLLVESMFLLLRLDTDVEGWAYLKKNPQQEIHKRSQQQEATDRATKIMMRLGKEPIDMDLHFFKGQHQESMERFAGIEKALAQLAASQLVPELVDKQSESPPTAAEQKAAALVARARGARTPSSRSGTPPRREVTPPKLEKPDSARP